MCCKPNEQLFPRQVVIQLPKYVTHIIGESKYKYGKQEQVTVLKEPQNKYCLGMVSIKILGGLNQF